MLPRDAPSRFDLLLVAMGAPLVGGFGVGLLTAVPLLAAAAVGSVAASVALAAGFVWAPC